MFRKLFENIPLNKKWPKMIFIMNQNFKFYYYVFENITLYFPVLTPNNAYKLCTNIHSLYTRWRSNVLCTTNNATTNAIASICNDNICHHHTNSGIIIHATNITIITNIKWYYNYYFGRRKLHNIKWTITVLSSISNSLLSARSASTK